MRVKQGDDFLLGPVDKGRTGDLEKLAGLLQKSRIAVVSTDKAIEPRQQAALVAVIE